MACAVETVDELGAKSEARAMSHEEVAAVCASPVFRSGVFCRDGATVHPGRLVRALRAAALDAGVRIFERTPVARIRAGASGSVEVETADGGIRTGSVVVATGAWMSGWRPVANRVTNMG